MVIERPIHGFNSWDREDRRPRLSRGALLTIAAVAGLHLAGAAYLYSVRMAPPKIDAPPEPPVILVDPVRLAPDTPPPPLKAPPKAPPRILPLHPPLLTTQPPIETLPVRAPLNPPAPIDDSPPRIADTASPPTPPAPPQPKVIRNPAWLARPSPDQLAGFYPAGALDRGVAGVAVLDCSVTASGQLTRCAVSGETPAREGFAAAALKAAHIFRMSPKTEDGQPVEGGVVHIPIHFAPD